MKTLLPSLVSITCLALNAFAAHAALPKDKDSANIEHSSVQDQVLITGMHGQVDQSQSLLPNPFYDFQDAGIKTPEKRILQGLYVDMKPHVVTDAFDTASLWPERESLRLVPWLDDPKADERFMLGYRWKRLSIEGATLQSSRRGDENAGQQGSAARTNWRSTRLSFSPAENWMIKLSRGAVSNLDNLVPGDQVRRTALAASHSLPFTGGTWETTLAWGRNARKNRESHSGYLVESTLRFAGVHSMFGRIEQIGSDSLVRQNEAVQRQLFKLNRVTLGYYQDLRIKGPIGMDVGAFVSRHLVPSDMVSSYGKDPTAYMMFVRLKMQ